MDLRQLETFLAVVDEGGVTAASAVLHVSQPAVSQTIRGLERELGVELFHRVGRRVHLSAAGAALEPGARRAVRDVDVARAAVDAVVGLEAGTLDLVCLPTLAVEPTARWIGALRAAHPGLDVRVAEPETTADVLGLLASGAAEVAVSEVDGLGDGVVVRPVAEQRLSFVGPADHPHRGRTLASFVDEPLLASPPGTSTRQAIERAFADIGATPRIAVETSHREALVPLALAGAGFALVPEAMADVARRRGGTVIEVTPPIVRTIGLVHRDAPLSPAAAAFLTLADAEAPA